MSEPFVLEFGGKLEETPHCHLRVRDEATRAIWRLDDALRSYPLGARVHVKVEVTELEEATVPRLEWTRRGGKLGTLATYLGRSERGGSVVADVMPGIGYYLWRTFDEDDTIVRQGHESTKTLAKRAAERAVNDHA